ncbi:hypothetical protein [Nitrosovibrio sp. Nv6]|uniref:hypothetical protein n=1 Tax=Nitrosovibrio sp. Nv6 TaxID=1855340 RepID=UPI0008D1BFFD|nr:hypothetical protein [Nitrosovibrio sp. Nv6]SEO79267.1 hypothetical protein SAMN05216316_1115 [Nitrosovibrio sp. Nv6]
MSHTEGKLTVAPGQHCVFDDNEKYVASTETQNKSDAEDAENARRLVACWNEHDGLVHDNAQLYQSLQGEMRARLEAEKERDELLHTLRFGDSKKIEAILARYQEGK